MSNVNETSCCGVMELGDVGGSSKSQILSSIVSAKRRRAGMVYCTTTQNQTAMHRTLKSVGFKQARKFKNPNTGNTIRFWMMPTSAVKMPRRPAMPRRNGTMAYEVVDHRADGGYYEWVANANAEAGYTAYQRQLNDWNNNPTTNGQWRWIDDEDYDD